LKNGKYPKTGSSNFLLKIHVSVVTTATPAVLSSPGKNTAWVKVVNNNYTPHKTGRQKGSQ
jgi:hypothetical protein